MERPPPYNPYNANSSSYSESHAQTIRHDPHRRTCNSLPRPPVPRLRSNALDYFDPPSFTQRQRRRPDSYKSARENVSPSKEEDSVCVHNHRVADNQVASLISPFRLPPPPPPSPTRTQTSELCCSSIRYICSWGFKSHKSNELQTPIKLSLSIAGNLLLVDPSAMRVYIYAENGKNLSEFEVLGVEGGCFWTDDKLALATHRGIKIYQINGTLIKEITLGMVLNTKPYNNGFIAIQKEQLLIYGGRENILVKTIATKRKPGLFRLRTKFKSISDVSSNSLNQIVVLDVGRNCVYVVDNSGIVKLKVSLSSVHSCGPTDGVYTITVDSHDSIIMSDSGNKRVLQFSSGGTFLNCLVDFGKKSDGGINPSAPFVYGLAVNHSSRLYIATSYSKFSEIKVYGLESRS